MLTHSETPTPEEIALFYDQVGEVLAELMGDNIHVGYWSDASDGSSMEQATDRMTDSLIDELGGGTGQRVLDVGCGTGRSAARLVKATEAELVGVTISPRQVELATARAEAAGLEDSMRFECVDAMALPFPAESFDAAWAIESLPQMPNRVHVLREIARVLRPGGRFVATDVVRREPTMSEDEDRAIDDVYDMCKIVDFPSLDTYPKLVREGHFRLEKLAEVGDESLNRTYSLFAEEFVNRRSELASRMGVSTAQYDLLANKLLGLDKIENLGYIVVVATRADVSATGSAAT